MGGLRERVALQVIRLQAGLRQQFVQQHAGAGAQGAVDKAGTGARHVLQIHERLRIAWRHHQALRALCKADDLVQAWF